MKVAIGNDHSAVELKNEVMEYVKSLGHEVINLGTDSSESCHYPVYGEKVGRAVADGLRNPDLWHRGWHLSGGQQDQRNSLRRMFGYYHGTSD